jgi:bifunctional DNA-binding transcriptional regulator/antitoxin component of YhaV-PrlF toxin-antitoxin module
MDADGRLVVPKALRVELGITGPTDLEAVPRDGVIECGRVGPRRRYAGSAARRRCRPYRPVVSSPSPSEPDLRLPPHPALHEHAGVVTHRAARVGSGVPTATRQRSARVHRRPPPIRTCCVLTGPPSPCGRLSRPPWWVVTPTTSTGPPPRPGGNSGRRACPKPRRVRRAPPGRFPRSLIHRSAGSAPSCTPKASPRATATLHAASPARTGNGRTRRSSAATRTERLDSP